MTFLRTFVSSAFRPRQHSYDSNIETRYINRELSWLNFNERVLSLVADPDIPLLERCRFSSIFSSNLDEFFQIRVAALKDQVEAGVMERTPDGRTPQEQLDDIGVIVADLVGRQESLWTEVLKPELTSNAIEIVTWDSLNSIDREHLVNEFESRIFPVLTPLAVDPAHPFPYISNLALNLAVVARDPRTNDHRFARVKLPQTFPRFMPLAVGMRFVMLEDVVAANLGRLFQGMTIEQCFTFRVTRNADLSLDDEDAEDLLAAVEMELRRRRFGRAVRLEVPEDISRDVLDLMVDELELDKSDVTFHRSIIDMSGLSQLASLDKPKIRYRTWKPLTAGRLAAAEESGRSIFSVIRERQLLVHHPHESFSSSADAFVQQAAVDPNVLSIKMTLYRTSGDSSIARHLIKASELGKQVAVVLELQARFDEARNVSWAKELEYAGVHVTYGIVGLKTHAKCILIVRNDPDRMRRYVHVGTGNYNSVTARLYEDIGYFTCEESVGSDVTELFNYLTGYGQEPNYQSLIVAPHQLRSKIIDLVNKEISYGTDGRITLKLNSVSDPQVIDSLYAASQAGVQVEAIVRGICCIRAGVPGLSDNIRVRSILGRYLEHSRIYRFGHGSSDESALHLIGSADLMGRNLDDRVEALVPLTHEKHRMWLDAVLGFLLDDSVVHFALMPDDTWERRGTDGFTNDAQQRLHEWVVATQVR